ncbi:MAG: hypothetical protein D6692_00955 [Planctomycetota bacterium]|nr:MAG: hypothetical protein D6692_00955 [Planctomycetota bacterium]
MWPCAAQRFLSIRAANFNKTGDALLRFKGGGIVQRVHAGRQAWHGAEQLERSGEPEIQPMTRTWWKKRRRLVVLSAVCGAIGLAAAGAALALGDGDHTCTNCHSQDADLCDTRVCGSGEVCSGDEGSFRDGSLWVQALCKRKDGVQVIP